MADVSPAVTCLSASAFETASSVAKVLDAEVHGLGTRVAQADVTFTNTMEHLRSLFAAGVPLVGVCASGILIRAVSPLLTDKWSEPPVLSISEDGQSVVPLLGGHHGANALARRIAEALGGHAAITTAGDIAFGVALDEPPVGWRLANPQDAKGVAAQLLSGSAVTVHGDAPWLSALPRGDQSAHKILVTETSRQGSEDLLVYHPQSLTLGVGCARGCPPGELSALVKEALQNADLSAKSIAGIFSLDLKADEEAVLALAHEYEVPLRLFDAETLEGEADRLAHPSDIVFAEVGCHGVSEAAALAAAGPQGTLVVEKRKSASATCAIARAPAPVTTLSGRKRGRVALVGIGPGQADWRTPEASKLIVEADELVGYGLYIDLLGPLAAGKIRRDFALGEEEDRCRYALERAGEGLDVAVICSGDAGIYAMSALVFELLDRSETAGGVGGGARRVEVISAPGVSALQAAAARAGAPLGHDFCAISLSDLLTPRETIIRRLKAAAEGDFVIAFYNPVSKRRRTLLGQARDMLLVHRPPDTPVILASNLGRPQEQLKCIALKDLDVDDVDMLTVVLVGASQSRLLQLGDGPRVYTPRGYAKRIDGIVA